MVSHLMQSTSSPWLAMAAGAVIKAVLLNDALEDILTRIDALVHERCDCACPFMGEKVPGLRQQSNWQGVPEMSGEKACR